MGGLERGLVYVRHKTKKLHPSWSKARRKGKAAVQEERKGGRVGKTQDYEAKRKKEREDPSFESLPGEKGIREEKGQKRDWRKVASKMKRRRKDINALFQRGVLYCTGTCLMQYVLQGKMEKTRKKEGILYQPTQNHKGYEDPFLVQSPAYRDT